MAEDVELVVNGERLAGFRAATVTQTFEAQLTATTWSVQYSTRDDDRSDPINVEAGDAIAIEVGDERLVRGYVVGTTDEASATEDTMQVSGASRLIDVVQCSAIARSRVFRGQTVFQIARALLADYDVLIDDRVQADEPLERFAIQEGESISDALARACRLRAVVLADVAGDLVITRVGAERTETVIERGRNVLRGSRSTSWAQRFSEYRFRGQTRATDELYGLAAAQLGHTIEDRGVARLRRLVVQAHAHGGGDLGRRAILERNVRAGRSERLEYEVPGWTCAEGLWRPNTRVRVVDPRLRVDAELLIVTVRHQFGVSPSRHRTTLELTRPEAFSELTYPTRARGAAWR